MKRLAQKCVYSLLPLLWWQASGHAQEWIPTSAPQTNWACVAASADGARLWAVVNGGPIYTSADAGGTWTPSSAPATNWTCIACSADGSRVVAVGAAGSSPLYTSADAGAHWTANPPPNVISWFSGWRCVASSADGTKLLALPGVTGVPLCASADSGRTWQVPDTLIFPIGYSRWWVAMSADGLRAATAVVFMGNAGVDCWTNMTAYPLASWARLGSGFCTAIASSADGNKLVALIASLPGVGDCPQQLVASTDAGKTWTVNCAWPTTNLTSVALSADGTKAVAVGPGDRMWWTTNSGLFWQPASLPGGNWVSVASSASGAKLVAAMQGGGLYTWHTPPTPELQVRAGQTNLRISWGVPSRPLALQESSDLTPASWTNTAAQPQLNLTNLNYELTVPFQAGNHFYRLVERPQ